jgi:hypothetical protein
MNEKELLRLIERSFPQTRAREISDLFDGPRALEDPEMQQMAGVLLGRAWPEISSEENHSVDTVTVCFSAFSPWKSVTSYGLPASAKM